MVVVLSCANKGLRGHTTDVHTRTADGALLNDGNLRAELSPFDRGREGGRAASHDHEVVVCTCYLWNLPLPRDRALLPHEGTVARSLDSINEHFIGNRVTGQDCSFPRLLGRQPDLVDTVNT